MESLSETDAMVELIPSSDQRLLTRQVLSKTALVVAVILGLVLACAGGSFKLARPPASSKGSDYIGLAANEWAGVLSDDAMKQMQEVSAEQASGVGGDTDDTTAAPAVSEVLPATEATPATLAPPPTTREPPATEMPTATEANVLATTNAPQTTQAAAPETDPLAPQMDPLMTEAVNSQTASTGAASSATPATATAARGAAAAGAATAASAAAAHFAAFAGADAETAAETMMVGQAGKVANAVAQKAESTLEAKLNEKPPPCTGPNCCLGSSCMGVPGFRCHDNRGTTTCVGSNALSFTEGMCRCVTGPCNVGGFCPDAPKIGGKSPGGGAIPASSSALAETSANPTEGAASAPNAVSTPWSR
eukprot:TRINITY_DN41699_c0_g1_i1.p1 TRINITY_DN41699_c0_g1~~TRINITY_DN41699_c0_g1_i1.p1  ORF type:complete len:390 (-),score=79.33 TRINITY_DN41699_c0_g1_i1:141-1229(-)